MTRVADLSRAHFMLTQFQQLQNRGFEVERQLSTGKVAEYFKDIPQDTGLLLSAKSMDTRIGLYQDTAQFVLSRFELQNVQLESLATAAKELRLDTLNSISLESGTGYMEKINQVFQTALGLMNSKVDGNYIYGGTRTDVPPVNVSTLAELIAAPDIPSIFENSNKKLANRIDDNIVMEHSFLADDIASEIFDAVKRIAEFNASPSGPFQANLTVAQRDFLESEMANLESLADNLNEVVAQNGRRHNQVSLIVERHDSMKVYVEGFISDIEEVDVPEAITRLNQNQMATQASMQMLSSLQRLTLLDYI